MASLQRALEKERLRLVCSALNSIAAPPDSDEDAGLPTDRNSLERWLEEQERKWQVGKLDDTDRNALTECYQKATQDWNTVLNLEDAQIKKHLSDGPKGKVAFDKDEVAWRTREAKELATLEQQLGSRPDKSLIIATRSYQIMCGRVRFLSGRLH